MPNYFLCEAGHTHPRPGQKTRFENTDVLHTSPRGFLRLGVMSNDRSMHRERFVGGISMVRQSRLS